MFPATSTARAGGAAARCAPRRGRRARGARRRGTGRPGEADGRRTGDPGGAPLRREGIMGRLRQGRIQVPVVPLRPDGSALRVAPRRHEEESPCRRRRRRPHARSRGPRNRLAWDDHGGLEVDRADRRSEAARLGQPADHLGKGRTGKHAQGRTRHVEARTGIVQLSVGALHRCGTSLCPDQGRDGRQSRRRGR